MTHLSLVKAQDAAMASLAVTLKDSASLLFFARGNNFATALEAALKVCGHVCATLSWLDMTHSLVLHCSSSSSRAFCSHTLLGGTP